MLLPPFRRFSIGIRSTDFAGRAPRWSCIVIALLWALLPGVSLAQAPLTSRPTLAQALEALEKAGLRLVYSSQIVTPDLLVDREPTAPDLPGRLEQLLAPHGLQARPLPDGSYAIVRAAAGTPGALVIVARLAPGQEALVGAEVWLSGSPTRVATDREGRARLSGLAPGSYTLNVGAECCREARLTDVRIGAGAETTVAVVLEPFRQVTEEIVVHASRYALGRETAARPIELPRSDLTSLPAVTEDAVRALHRLPGTASGGLSARSHVRGSYEDEMLVLYDGVRLYNPFHLKDFQALFGVIDPEILDSVEYYSGGFPAWYGGRAGGVLDISPRKAQGSETLLGLSFLNSRVISSGEAFAGQGQWLVGYRRSNVSAVIRALQRDVGEPEFEDFVLRYEHELRPDTQLTMGLLGVDDRLDLFTEDRSEDATASYRDRYVWASIEHDWNDWLNTKLRLSDARLSVKRAGEVQRPAISVGSLSERRETDIDVIGVDFSATPAANYRLQWGVEASDVSAEYGYASRASFEDPLATAFGRDAFEQRDFTSDPDGGVYAAYLTGRLELGRWLGEIGVRWDRASYIDAEDQWSPRLSLRRELGEGTTLRITAGRFTQFQAINELAVEESSPAFAAPESSWHAIVGLEHDFDAPLTLRLEGFYRRSNDVRARFENQLDPLVLLPEIEIDRLRVAPRNSRTWGAELSLQSGAAGSWSWWGSYSWAEAHDEFADFESLRSWDQRHAVTGGMQWARGPWRATLAVSWHAGWPYASLELIPAQAGVGYGEAELGPRNGERFPDFFSLDLHVEYTWRLPIGSLEAFAEVLNLTNRENECCREVEVTPLPAAWDIDIERESWMTIVPILGVNWRF